MAGIGSVGVTTPTATMIPMAILLTAPTIQMVTEATQKMVTMVIPIQMAAITMTVTRATTTMVASMEPVTVPAHMVAGLVTMQAAKPAHALPEQMQEADPDSDLVQAVL